MVRGSACLLSVWVVAGCSSGVEKASFGRSGSVVADERTRLVDALSGLCQARQQAGTDPRAAKATYDRRSREGVATTARLLLPSYSRTSAALTRATERVQADLAPEPAAATLDVDLGRLIEELRRSLSLLGIATEAC